MVNSAQIQSRRRERKRVHAPSMQAMQSLMEFLGKLIQKYPSSSKIINAMIT